MPDAGEPGGPRELGVSWRLSAHARRLVTLALTGLVLAVATGRPEFAGLAAPAALVLAGLPAARPRQAGLRAALADPLLVEGSDSAVTASITAPGELTAELAVEPGEDITAGPPVELAAVADAGTPATAVRSARLPFTPLRWGRRPAGFLAVTLRDPLRLTEGRAATALPPVECRPAPASLHASVVLSRLPNRLGEHASRAAGEGGEFAGVREFVPGDRQRRINWPATTRRGTLFLSTFADERTQNTVIIADATTDVGPAGASSLDLVLRGAAGAMTRYLTQRDRVGLIITGRTLAWIGPGQGQRHLQRLTDLLMSAPAGWGPSAALARLPRAALPPGALVIVFSPLLDTGLIEAVRDLRERGFTLLVIDVLNAMPPAIGGGQWRLARRLWRLEQDAIRFSLTELGVPVAHWDGVSSLDEPLGPYTRRVMVAQR